MESFHTLFRLSILLLVLTCSKGVTAQTSKAAQNNSQPVPLQSTNNGDTITEREFTGKVYDVVEEPPSFPGGQIALLSWLTENVHYSSEYGDICISGRAVLSFVVEPDGSLSNIQVVRKLDPVLDDEAIRVVKAMPKWIPGKQNGQMVRVKYNLPIPFRLK